MSRYVQMAVYALCAAILIVDGVKTLQRKENMFFRKADAAASVPAGLLLFSAAGTVILFAVWTLFHISWAMRGMWCFIILTGIMTIAYVMRQQK